MNVYIKAQVILDATNTKEVSKTKEMISSVWRRNGEQGSSMQSLQVTAGVYKYHVFQGLIRGLPQMHSLNLLEPSTQTDPLVCTEAPDGNS